jgi:hypothetical protein
MKAMSAKASALRGSSMRSLTQDLAGVPQTSLNIMFERSRVEQLGALVEERTPYSGASRLVPGLFDGEIGRLLDHVLAWRAVEGGGCAYQEH